MRTTGAGAASRRSGTHDREDRQRRDEQQPVRPVAQREDAAEDEARGLRGEDQAPGRSTAEILVRDDGPQHGPRADERRVDERELEHDPPEPRARAERGPALAQLANEVALRHRQALRQPEGDEERGSEEVGGRVERERPARAGRRHQNSSRRGSDDLRAVPREAQQRVRLLEQASADRLRDDALRRREEERARDAPNDLERDQVPDLGSAGQDEHGHRCLRGTGDDVGGHHHVVPRQPVGPDSADEDEEDLRDEARSDDEADVRRRPGQVEDGECDRDGRERAPEERDRPPEEEQPELPLAERRQRGAEHRPKPTRAVGSGFSLTPSAPQSSPSQ